MRNLLSGVQLVGGDHLLQEEIGKSEAFADDLAFGLDVVMAVLGSLDATVLGDSSLKRLLPHHRAVHLFLGKPAEEVRDFLVRDAQRLVQRLPLHHLGECRG